MITRRKNCAEMCCTGECEQGDTCPLYRNSDSAPKAPDVGELMPRFNPFRWLAWGVAIALVLTVVAQLVRADSERAEAFRRECREVHNGSTFFDQRTQRLACRVPAQEVQQP